MNSTSQWIKQSAALKSATMLAAFLYILSWHMMIHCGVTDYAVSANVLSFGMFGICLAIRIYAEFLN